MVYNRTVVLCHRGKGFRYDRNNLLSHPAATEWPIVVKGCVIDGSAYIELVRPSDLDSDGLYEGHVELENTWGAVACIIVSKDMPEAVLDILLEKIMADRTTRPAIFRG